jgi:hypothetical protein
MRAALAAGPATEAWPVTEVSLALKATWMSVTAARMAPALLLSGAAGHVVALKREWAAQPQASSLGRTAARIIQILQELQNTFFYDMWSCGPVSSSSP